ncbi:probable 28S ribosomal protein S26, mitochondrial [Daktulosphaira vitifoliae]|uniref:probable 28S ribosomal protein S26, mitochondrial n=1 Tax=Daktulosphaira vitifoliae TaxID=58002 RepID=UPI0021AA92A7|nr:probable 28S ribosomal protein S26, mitochondrial [Daktulosphaira vitifoliae]
MQNFCRTEFLFSNLLSKAINQQPVRYTRKPRWVKKAPSKIFKIPKRPQITEEERNELFNLFTTYRTCMKSIQKQLEEELEKSDIGNEVLQELARKEEEQWKKCLQINEKWNTQIALARDERLVKEKEILRNDILKHLMENEEEQIKKLKEIEEIVRLEKEKSKTYITVHNIDDAINNTLDNIVDHNYAIDLNGNIHRGNISKNISATEHSKKNTHVQSINS